MEDHDNPSQHYLIAYAGIPVGYEIGVLAKRIEVVSEVVVGEEVGDEHLKGDVAEYCLELHKTKRTKMVMRTVVQM